MWLSTFTIILSSTKALSSFCSCAKDGAENNTMAIALLTKYFKIFPFRCIFINLVFQFFRKFYFSFILNNVFDILPYKLQWGYVVADLVAIHLQEIQKTLIAGFEVRIGFQELNFIGEVSQWRIDCKLIKFNP